MKQFLILLSRWVEEVGNLVCQADKDRCSQVSSFLERSDMLMCFISFKIHLVVKYFLECFA